MDMYIPICNIPSVQLLNFGLFSFTGTVFLSKHSKGVHMVHDQKFPERLNFITEAGYSQSCKSNDTIHMYDCYDLSENSLDFTQCGISVNDQVRRGNLRYQSIKKKNLKFIRDIDKLPTECPGQNTDFDAEKIRENMESWVLSMSLPEVDPFWMMEPSSEPLDPLDPRIDITFLALTERPGFNHLPMEIRSRRKELFKGNLINGRLQGNVEDSADLPDWFSQLYFFVPDKRNLKSIEGMVITTDPYAESNAVVVGRLQHGRLHGPVRIFMPVSNDPKSYCGGNRLTEKLSFIGHMVDGIPTGYCWKGLLGGAWIHGKVDGQGEFTGNDIAYVYPDFKTALVGKFEKGIMVRYILF